MAQANGPAIHEGGPTGHVAADLGAAGEDGAGEAGATGAGEFEHEWRDDHGLRGWVGREWDDDWERLEEGGIESNKWRIKTSGV